MRDRYQRLCFSLLCAVSLRLPLKTRLGEVMVECQRGLDFHTSHHRKGNAVGEGKLFVVVLLESLEPCREVFHTDVQEIDRGAGTQATRDGHSTSVIQTSTDESERFIENVGSNNERLRALFETTFRTRSLACNADRLRLPAPV